MSKDLDPMEAIDQEDYADPTGPPVMDKSNPSYVDPRPGIKPLDGGK